jgi:predicted transcriptional regulator of viral defense system
MRKSIITIEHIKMLGRPIFTTREISDLSGKSISTTTQSLNYLAQHNVIKKLYRGIWAEITNKLLSPYMLIPHLLKSNRVYVSFLSALHLHGIIEQIPQTITLASTSHTKKIKTAVGIFIVHQISPAFFSGFDWDKGTKSFLVAEPEKALADCLYLFTRKKKQYGFFPELNFKRPFSVQKVKEWVQKIPDRKSRVAVKAKFDEILRVNGI